MPQFDAIRFQPSRPLLKEISAERLNAVVQEIRRNKPKGERGITVRQTGDGTYIGLAASIRGGVSSVSQSRRPWDIYVSETAENGNYKVKVVPGTIGGFLPLNWDEEFDVDKDATIFGCLQVATDGFLITSVTISMLEEPAEPSQPEPYALSELATYTFGIFAQGNNYRIASQGDIAFSPQIYMTKEKETPAAAGESPYEVFYILA